MSAGLHAASVAGSLAAEIASRGYCVRPRFLDASTTHALRAECLSLHAAGGFRPAGIGKATQRLPATRSDETAWLDLERSGPGVATAIQRLEDLRLGFNRTLYLGLFEFECHFAHFPPGAHYRRHRDQLRGESVRRLSCVLYLNENWTEQDGGTLRIYLDGSGRTLDVQPVGGTLVCFLSEQFEHEVLPAARDRWSLTGWFRTR